MRLVENVSAVCVQTLEPDAMWMIGPFDLEAIADESMMLQRDLLGLKIRGGEERDDKDRFVSCSVHRPPSIPLTAPSQLAIFVIPELHRDATFVCFKTYFPLRADPA